MALSKEEKQQLDNRAKYILNLANQNLGIVIDQVETIEGKDYKDILACLDKAKTAIGKELNGASGG